MAAPEQVDRRFDHIPPDCACGHRFDQTEERLGDPLDSLLVHPHPSSQSSAWIRGEPSRPRLAAWMPAPAGAEPALVRRLMVAAGRC
jgi:hypothetical protein